jgi:hypothetical protein
LGKVGFSPKPETPAGKTLDANQYASWEFRKHRGPIHERGSRQE